MQILVDADACPAKGIIVRIARERNIPVTMVTDTSHVIYDGYSTVVTVDKSKESADIALINRTRAGDIVITQDYGLAAMVLGRSAKALHPGGLIYTDANIDRLLMERHIGQKIRRGGGRTKGPARRTHEDDERFEKALLQMVGGASLIPGT
jgi:uncharacterized protein YaiI (UPF0178 family)